MTRAIPAALNTHLQGTSTTLSTCVKVKRRDGVILGFTDADADIAFDLGDGDGPLTYAAATAYTRSELAHQQGLQVDNLDLEGILDSAAISAADLRGRRYDFAEATMFLVNRESPADGHVILRHGRIGEVQIKDNTYVAELRGLTQAYSQVVGEVYTADCRADLGDTRCKVRTDPPAWQPLTAYTLRETGDADTGSVVKPTTQNKVFAKCTVAGVSASGEPAWPTSDGATVVDGTVTWQMFKATSLTGTVQAVTDRRVFEGDAGIDIETDWWTLGNVEWLTGANAGLTMEVKRDKEIDTGLPVVEAIATTPGGATINVPSGVNAGETLLAVLISTGAPAPFITPPAGWVELNDQTLGIQTHSYAAYKKADGTESGTMTFSGANGGFMVRISNAADPIVTPPEFRGPTDTGTGATSNAGASFSPAGGSQSYIWFSPLWLENSKTPTFPANFPDHNLTAWGRIHLAADSASPAAPASSHAGPTTWSWFGGSRSRTTIISVYPRPSARSDIELYLPMPFDIQVGDTFRLTTGCDKFLSTCVDKFDNVENFRGEPYVPGQDVQFQTPDARLG